jgi:hypothetical protein
MTTNNFQMTKIDPDAERRRALGKIYSLLLKLAEKEENQPSLTEVTVEENTTKSDSISQNIPP